MTQAIQKPPGKEAAMKPKPQEDDADYKPSGRLNGKVALITGGDSGIGKAVCLLFAKEGADIAFVYLNEHEDARRTCQLVESYGRKCLSIAGDLGDEDFCRQCVEKTIGTFGQMDILVNNAGEHVEQFSIEVISRAQLEKTFRTNVFSMFFLTKAALPHLEKGSAIINTASITAYRGSDHLIDYAATKGAIVAFTRSLSKSLVERGIRVNGVAPGPIWTPLIVSTFSEEDVKEFGKDTPMKRPGQPVEVAPCFLFLASEDSSYMTGQMLHPNGGEFVTS